MSYISPMTNSATIHARIDPATKEQSENVLKEIGMSPTDAVRLLYRQIALRKEFPLELRVPNQLTADTLDQTDQGKGLETFDSLEAFKSSWK
ncbi:MAG: type II toxin-antitoxin system RelB/DinJ family antitoxin [Opitutales bacterium]|nr:type II toxin-antitoxin system RelB/DinJ family antitoxin [Opitutales bacterium]